jgi:hypothetical protein
MEVNTLRAHPKQEKNVVNGLRDSSISQTDTSTVNLSKIAEESRFLISFPDLRLGIFSRRWYYLNVGKNVEYLRLIRTAIQVETMGNWAVNRSSSIAPRGETLSWVIVL